MYSEGSNLDPLELCLMKNLDSYGYNHFDIV